MAKPACDKVICLLIGLFALTSASPSPDLIPRGSRTRRSVHCREGLEYLSGNICCLNCPAGSRMISPCTTAGQKGICEECDYGTFTAHSNHLNHCLKCTQCYPDKDTVKACTHNADAECRCKPGAFCDPNEACEVCKKCSRCAEDEELVRNCTPTSNTECKELQPQSVFANPFLVLVLVLCAAVPLMILVACCYRHHRATGSQRNPSYGLKAEQGPCNSRTTEEGINGGTRNLSHSSLILPLHLVRPRLSGHQEEERIVLCESLSSSTSNSQHSLTGLTAYALPAPPLQAGPLVTTQPIKREEEPFPNLVAQNGEQSLRKCFEYFEDVDVDVHKKFFRQLEISDNVIKGKDQLTYEDKIHELLNIWIEKEGRQASLNDLLKALLDLNQRRTAEVIKDKAVNEGYYIIA